MHLWQNIRPYILVITSGLSAPILWLVLCLACGREDVLWYVLPSAIAGGILISLETSSWQRRGRLIGRGVELASFVFAAIVPTIQFFFWHETKPEISQEKQSAQTRQKDHSADQATQQKEKQSPPVPALNRVDVNNWFNHHYASIEGFQPLFTPTELRFQIIPCLGYHLPPVNLALLPTGTEWTCEVEDGQEYGLLNNGHEKNLWLLGQGKLKKHTNMSMQGYIGRLFGDFVLGDNPIFLLEAEKKEVKDKDERLQYSMKFNFGVSAEDNQLRRVFEKRFGLLKKQDNQWVNRTDDLDKDVKVMDLPARIGSQAVFWDLSIRCLPLWLAEVKDGKVRGRWMPDRQLSPKHLNFFTPQIKIATATGTNVPGQQDQWIFADSSGKLLSTGGCFETSVEKMKETVQDSRHKQQQSKFDWLGDGALYIRVPTMLDEKGLPTGMTVQVVCRIRADNQSFVK